MNCMTFLLGNQHWDDFGLSKMGDTSFLQTDKSLAGTSQHARIAPPEIQKKIGRYFKTAWRKRCLTLCDGFGVHPSFRQNMFLAVGSQTWTMSTKNSWFYSSKLGIKASTMSWKQKDLQIDVISRYVLYVGISLAKEWVGYLHPINQKLAMYIYHM